MYICLVKGISIMGYHGKFQYYFKIYLLSGFVQKKLADVIFQIIYSYSSLVQRDSTLGDIKILKLGSIMNCILQPFEAHIPFDLQFQTDFNLFGMDYLVLKTCKFRMNKDNQLVIKRQNPGGTYLEEQDCLMIGVSNLIRETKMELELDAYPWDIANREWVKERAMDPFLGLVDLDRRLVFLV